MQCEKLWAIVRERGCRSPWTFFPMPFSGPSDCFHKHVESNIHCWRDGKWFIIKSKCCIQLSAKAWLTLLPFYFQGRWKQKVPVCMKLWERWGFVCMKGRIPVPKKRSMKYHWSAGSLMDGMISSVQPHSHISVLFISALSSLQCPKTADRMGECKHWNI